jgi:hypothetical protein
MKEDFYSNLKKKLEEQFDWPSLYLFKFIIPSDNKKLALVKALFGAEAEVKTKQSKNNKYISISAKEIMVSPDEIITIYKNAEAIEGIISL